MMMPHNDTEYLALIRAEAYRQGLKDAIACICSGCRDNIPITSWPESRTPYSDIHIVPGGNGKYICCGSKAIRELLDGRSTEPKS